MNIKTYTRANDLCLLEYGERNYYLGCIDLPQDSWTILEYNKWCNEYTVNLISLTDNYIPQMLCNGSMRIVDTLSGCTNYFADKYEIGEQRNNVLRGFKEMLLVLLSPEAKGKIESTFSGYIRDSFKKYSESLNQQV